VINFVIRDDDNVTRTEKAFNGNVKRLPEAGLLALHPMLPLE
jgi:hypothetical protein